MVLVLKHWKSRSPPGIAAGAKRENPFIMSFKKPLPARPSGGFLVSGGDASPEVNHITAGWSSPVARQAHNLKVVGSNPTPATNLILNERSECEGSGCPRAGGAH